MYWCSVERKLRKDVFSGFEKNQDAPVSEDHTGRLFTIDCKRLRMWAWESDYELRLESPGDSVYNNGDYRKIMEDWTGKYGVPSRVSNLLMDLAGKSDTGSRHPLRFIHPRYRYAVAVYLMSCRFIADPDMMALFPSRLNIDRGYSISGALSIIDDVDKIPSDQGGPTETPDMLGILSRMKHAWGKLNGIPGVQDPPDSLIRDVREKVAEIFAVLRVQNVANIVDSIDYGLRTQIDPTQLQAVPSLSDELSVTKLPRGEIAVYLSKYFSPSEVLNPNFWDRDQFSQLNIILVGHRSFNPGAFLPNNPVIRTQRVIRGTIKRGTISTLTVPPGGGDKIRPSDVFYPSKPASVSPILSRALENIVSETEDAFFGPKGVYDDLAMFDGQNVLHTLSLAKNDADVYARLFHNADTASQEDTDDDEGGGVDFAADFYDAYADVFTFLHTYQRRAQLTDALNGYVSSIVTDGPVFNDGSVVYPITRSLVEETASALDLPGATSQMQYLVLTAYTAIDTAPLSGKRLEPTGSALRLINISGSLGANFYSKQRFMTPHGSLATLLAERAVGIQPHYTPKQSLPGVTWDEIPDVLDVTQGVLSIDPFVEDRTGRTHEVRFGVNNAMRFYDPLSDPRMIQPAPVSGESTGDVVVINSQWPWTKGVAIVQGDSPGPIDRARSVALTNIDYVLNDERSSLLFFAQARVKTTYNTRSGFSWIVGRYLGVDGYGPVSRIDVDPKWFIAREEEYDDVNGDGLPDFVIQDVDQWIPVDSFLPLLSTKQPGTYPTARVEVVTK